MKKNDVFRIPFLADNNKVVTVLWNRTTEKGDRERDRKEGERKREKLKVH